ncbi:uncharacterized protein BO80DRAFT_93834 [Aspergillus ibericus CBS 121593]|uniref:Uncharacterized protein n=1 Tax=Aspergillus ibericus CBS 121593 TaxID=1448316 RepID=A0A395GYJ6_9EURO|nr:hypothetical protein BO80DRAFT_93834 [Aspergillus ibericus CBS 121593]RAL00626.1 hypothetical protein BO80DRAFT_93834 [Aspergillus ibericus CBS 121593]
MYRAKGYRSWLASFICNPFCSPCVARISCLLFNPLSLFVSLAPAMVDISPCSSSSYILGEYQSLTRKSLAVLDSSAAPRWRPPCAFNDLLELAVRFPFFYRQEGV